MQHQPAPDRHDIEMMFLGRQPITAQSTPAPVPDVAPAVEDDYTPVEIARSRRLRLAHFTALCDYAERVAWLGVIVASLIVVIL